MVEPLVSLGGSPIAKAMVRAGNPSAQAIERYARAPNAFWREILQMEPDPWQEDANRALARGETRLSIRSGHGVGKGFWGSGTVVWFTCTRIPFKIGITAPSAPQLFDALFADVRAAYRRLPPEWLALFDVDADRVRLKIQPDECFVTARTSRADNPESLQGLHSKNLLLLVDEASGVAQPVFDAARGSMSTPGAITALLGNPTRSSGFFWRTHNTERARWWTKRVPCTESKRVDQKFIDEIADSYGVNSNQYRIRVLGEFPEAEDDALIPAELVESAMTRGADIDFAAAEIWGVDVARFGADQSVLIKRRGDVIPEMPRRWQGVDTMMLSGAIKAEYDILPPAARPALIVVDVIGIGAGVVDRLMEQELPILGLNVGEAPSVANRFVRLRDELWIRVREWLEARRARLPYDERLRTDLCAPRVRALSDGRLQVESKQMLRSRGYASPDTGDALCLTFAPAGMTLALGLGAMMNSRTPIRAPMRGME